MGESTHSNLEPFCLPSVVPGEYISGSVSRLVSYRMGVGGGSTRKGYEGTNSPKVA
jgi:hypothetical protein